MPSTTLRIYASRDTIVGAVQWIGGNTAYGLIKHWAKKSVERDENSELYLKGASLMEHVPVGNYVVLVGDYFHSLTPEEFDESYVRVEA